MKWFIHRACFVSVFESMHFLSNKFIFFSSRSSFLYIVYYSSHQVRNYHLSIVEVIAESMHLIQIKNETETC